MTQLVKTKANIFFYKLFILMLCFNQFEVQAQHQADHWIFNHDSHLSFLSGNAVYNDITSSPPFWQNEGSSSISDSIGNLLFYSSGVKVWDRNYNMLPNGDDLKGHITSTNSAMLIPLPGNPDVFYLFTADQGGYENAGQPSNPINEGIRYSVINLCRNEGNGDVLLEKKNVLLYRPATERIAAVYHQNGTDVWIVTHEFNSANFVLYLLTKNGITDSIKLSQGTTHVNDFYLNSFSNTLGQMKISPDGKWLGIVLYGSGIVEIFPFDNSTGNIGATYLSMRVSRPYGFEFSVDSKRFYVSSNLGSHVYEYDMKFNTEFLALKNRRLVYRSYFIKEIQNELANGGLQLASDGNIYSNNLTKFTYDESAGASFLDTAFMLNFVIPKIKKFEPIGSSITGFNSSYFDRTPRIEYSQTCFRDTIDFRLINKSSVKSVVWNFDDSGSGLANTSTEFYPDHVYHSEGPFNVSAVITMDDNTVVLSTRKVLLMDDFEINIGPDSILCNVGEIQLSAPKFEYACYTWENGSKEVTHGAKETGWYWVDVRMNGCVRRDSVHLNFANFSKVDLGSDRILCVGDSILIDGRTNDGVSYSWNDGETNPSRFINKSGIYSVRVSNALCSSVDTIFIEEQEYPTSSLPSDTTICEGQILELSIEQDGIICTWNDGIGTSRRSITHDGQYWVDVNLNTCVIRDSIFVHEIRFPDGDVDTLTCEGNPVLLGFQQPNSTYQWSSGEQVPSIEVSEKGIYTLTVRNKCYSESVQYNVDVENCSCDVFIPNVFTPNGDPHNEKFSAILHQNILSFEIVIFNRWGEVVLKSNDIHFKWDGTLQSGVEARGVYYFTVNYVCMNEGKKVKKDKKGWIEVKRVQ